MDTELLTSEQAYFAMFAFLEEFYAKRKWDDIGALLGLLAYWQDGMPASPKIMSDWEESVQKARAGGVDLRLRPGP